MAIVQDGCGSAPTVGFSDVVSNNCAGTKIIARTWTATDACGNTATALQTITVRDTTPPVVTAPPDLTLECPGDDRTNVTGVATAQDGCGSVTIGYSDSVSYTCGSARIITRTWTATDTCGNSTNAIQTITVRDTTPPTLMCAADRNLPTGSSWTFDMPAVVADACSGATLQVLSTVTNLTATNTLAATRTWSATDGCGNSSICRQTITVVLGTPPLITDQPIGQMAGYGTDATLSASATGTGPLAYQWRCNGRDVAGGTSNSLALKSVQFIDAGVYTLVVSNASGTATSSASVVNVAPKLFPQLTGNSLVLTWPGPFMLQSAANVNGPYTDVAGAASPYSYNPAGSPQRFFRLRSQPFTLTGGNLAGSQFRLDCPGIPGCVFVIQASTDLSAWQNVQTNSSPFSFVDTNSWQYPRRFYRAILAH